MTQELWRQIWTYTRSNESTDGDRIRIWNIWTNISCTFMFSYLGNNHTTGTPAPLGIKNEYGLGSSQNTPHEPSRYWLAWSMSLPFISLLAHFWGTLTHRTTYTLASGNIYIYIRRRIRFRLGRLRSRWDQVWMASACQSPGRIMCWQACVWIDCEYGVSFPNVRPR